MGRQVIAKIALYACALTALCILIPVLMDTFISGNRRVLSLAPVQPNEADLPVNQSGLNLNTATLEELTALPGIGEHLAEQIIQKRSEQPFFFIEDLRAVKGIGEKRIEALKPLAYVPLPETD